MDYSLQKNAAKNVDFGYPVRGRVGQQKVTVLFTFENVENVGRSLREFIKHLTFLYRIYQ